MYLDDGSDDSLYNGNMSWGRLYRQSRIRLTHHQSGCSDITRQSLGLQALVQSGAAMRCSSWQLWLWRRLFLLYRFSILVFVFLVIFAVGARVFNDRLGISFGVIKGPATLGSAEGRIVFPASESMKRFQGLIPEEND